MGHTDYAKKMDEILNIIGVRTKEPPKRITQLRLHPSWSKDSVRSPSNESLATSVLHSNGSLAPSGEICVSRSDGSASPGDGCLATTQEVASDGCQATELDVAMVQSKLKRLTTDCGMEDAEPAEEAWDFVNRDDADDTFPEQTKTEENLPTSQCNTRENSTSHSVAKDTVSETEVDTTAESVTKIGGDLRQSSEANEQRENSTTSSDVTSSGVEIVVSREGDKPSSSQHDHNTDHDVSPQMMDDPLQKLDDSSPDGPDSAIPAELPMSASVSRDSCLDSDTSTATDVSMTTAVSMATNDGSNEGLESDTDSVLIG